MHGGAGGETAEERAPRRAGLARAADAGWEVLARGGSALEAVVEAVVVLEDDPHFNAGLGSVLTVEGTLEMDASVMAGETLAAGAVGVVSGVMNRSGSRARCSPRAARCCSWARPRPRSRPATGSRAARPRPW